MAKCIECGFLATRDYESRDLAEVDSDFRRSGPPTAAPGSRRHSQERAPICFVQSVDLQAELLGALEPEYPGGSEARATLLDRIPADLVIELFRRDRPECDAGEKFTRWQQGFTPKEHRERLDRAELLRREDARDSLTRKREDDRDASLSDWQETQETVAERRHDEQMNESRRQHKWELMIFGGAIAIATLVAAVIEVVFGGVDLIFR